MSLQITYFYFLRDNYDILLELKLIYVLIALSRT